MITGTLVVPSSIGGDEHFSAPGHKKKTFIKNKARDRESIGIILIENSEKDTKRDFVDPEFEIKTLNMYNLILQSSHSSTSSIGNNSTSPF